MTQTHKYLVPAIVSLGIMLAVLLGVVLATSNPHMAVGSVSQGSEYNATSTAANSQFGAQTGDVLLKTGFGSIGSIVITGANTGVVNFYNATTTNVNARTGQKATTSILIASVPASAAAGTYVLDAEFTDGLYMDLHQGNMPTTTITWR